MLRPDMVRLEGFEPPTGWVETNYSVPLSYKRMEALVGVEPTNHCFAGNSLGRLGKAPKCVPGLYQTSDRHVKRLPVWAYPLDLYGLFDRIRTCDSLIRSQSL
jgi:hypothetical protein